MTGSRVTSASVRSRLIAGLALVTIGIASTAILAQRGKQRTATRENRIELVKSASSSAPTAFSGSSERTSPESLTSPSLWSKEYIHGPDGKVIATEERVLFTDVPESGDFYDDIYRIAARGVTLGCNPAPLQFCPDQSVNREQMSAFLMRGRGEFSPPPPPFQRFGDVPPSNDFYNFIDRLAVLGITLGCQPGNPPLYCPADPVKHEQMAAFIMRAIGEPDPPWPITQRFNDVPISGPNANPFANYIERMGALGIWQGQGCAGTNNYCPTAPVTRRQMAHILVKAFGI